MGGGGGGGGGGYNTSEYMTFTRWTIFHAFPLHICILQAMEVVIKA